MKKRFLPLLGLFMWLGLAGCLLPKKEKVVEKDSTASVIDSSLISQLRPDEYGMKNYVLVLLKKGEKKMKLDSATHANLLKGHRMTIQKLANEKKLILSGNTTTDSELKGIFIFDVKTPDEAKMLFASDPAIETGYFDVEYHPWYGSAALIKVAELHSKIAKKSY